jgi:ribosomal RNA-processing protein 8
MGQYHEGYRTQVSSWPSNPVDVVIRWLKTLPSNLTVADFGCGEAKIAQRY